MGSDTEKMRGYSTAAEYRAYVDGAGDCVEAVLSLLKTHWALGREDILLELVRDKLIEERIASAAYLRCANMMEGQRE